LGMYSRHWLIGLVWLFSIAQGFLFIISTPQWEGFDEAFHYAYIQEFAETGKLPIYGKTLLSKEVTASFSLVPLSTPVNSNMGNRYTSLGDYWRLPESVRKERETSLKNIPHEFRVISDESGDARPNYEAQHPPLYYLLCLPIYRLFSGSDLPTMVFALRIFSLLIGSLTIWIAFGLADGIVIPITISLLPMFISTVARISNDSLGVTLYSLLVWLTLKYWRSGGTYRLALYAGIAAGLGLLTKAYFLTAVPVLVIIVLVIGFRKKTAGLAIKHLAVLFSTIIVIACWWYLRNYRLYGTISGLFVLDSSTSLMDYFRYCFVVPWRSGINTIFRELIWTGNSSFTSLSKTIYYIAYLLAAVSLIGLIKIYSKVHVQNESTEKETLNVMMAFIFFFGTGLLYQMLESFISMQQIVTGGWYLYATIIPIIILLCKGIGALWPSINRYVPLAIIGFSALLNFLGYFCKSIPFYSGYFIPRFHLQNFFELYNPAGILAIGRRLSINKPEFINPAVVIAVIVTYALLLTFFVVISLRSQWRHRETGIAAIN
jgi:hypothetical protein